MLNSVVSRVVSFGANTICLPAALLFATCVVPPPGQPGSPGQPGAPLPARISLRVTAPLTIGDHVLGRPLDRNFESFVGPQGATIFGRDQAPQPVTTTPNVVQFESFTVDDRWSVRAHAAAWGLGSADLSVSSEKRFASYRALEITEIHAVDETQVMSDAPADAIWYVSKIYYGHSYEVIISGSKSEFHAGVQKKFKAGSGSINGFASSNKLTMKVVGKGLVPSGEALFAKTPNDIQKHYKRSGDPSPIFVEYRLIPGKTPPSAEPISWEEQKSAGGTYRVVSLSIWIGPRKDKPRWDAMDNKADPTITLAIDGDSRFFACEHKNVENQAEVNCPIGKTVKLKANSKFTIRADDKDSKKHDRIGTASAKLPSNASHAPIELKTDGSLNRAIVVLEGPI